ncbi:TetR/AcrR family transcriptional regulator [Agromyces sp. Marseille-P2726]|uniref:TetR/AcrR family transcriptional regulator n=1 Tax=Agromyces sp. Marseille-P2726 TaxID=2709132 RepID=UPI001C2CF9B4|nr:TetR/AcrR family transcriptional regulator [Agromyces sp. Marseille-P2726]
MKPGPRRSLSQADIVAAAFGILEAQGFGAVSVRRVAAAVGLTPAAMYTYFPSKAALLRAMVEQLLSTTDLAAASDDDRPWRDRVHALAAALRSRLAEHAGAIVLVTSGPLDGAHALALNEVLIAGFVREGMPDAEGAHAAHAVRSYVLGAALLDAGTAAAAGDGSHEPGVPLWSDAAGFPRSAATGDVSSGDAGFRFGLDRLLDGLERRVPVLE